MRNIKIVVEYDGTGFVGWQRQASGRSIQGEIESVLKQILQEGIILSGAGRTDAGVHARGQVANFRTETARSLPEIVRGLNGLLSHDIAVIDISEVSIGFHARYSAIEREYSYQISRKVTALMRNYSWFVQYPLDLGLMQHASGLLTGRRDFESFSKTGSGVTNFFCSVKEAVWREDGDFLRFTIRADRFLRGMVRALVGAMVDVGRAYTGLPDFLEIFEAKNHRKTFMLAPAKGLFLDRVYY